MQKKELIDKSKLKTWAEDAVEYCHSLATDSDKDKRIDKTFYAFQSEPILNPEVLILAINPAGDSTYAAQYTNEKVWGISKEGRMTPEVFMTQNPKWHNHKDWPIWANFEKVFHTDRLKSILDKENFVYMWLFWFVLCHRFRSGLCH
jgi:hypothetical protein